MTVPERHEGQNQVLVGGVFEMVLEMGVQLAVNPIELLLNVMEVIGSYIPGLSPGEKHKGEHNGRNGVERED